jgi:hypothetical protein
MATIATGAKLEDDTLDLLQAASDEVKAQFNADKASAASAAQTAAADAK